MNEKKPVKNASVISWKYLLQESILIVLVSFLLLFASTHNGLVNSLALGITTVLITLAVIIWLARGTTLAMKVELPAFVFLGALAVSTFFSIDPRRSAQELWLIGVGIFIFFAVAECVRRGLPAELAIKALLVSGAIIMALAWVSVVQWYMQWVETSGDWIPRLTFRLAVPNFFCAILNTLLAVALARLVTTRSTPGRVLLGVWSISALGLIYLTSSRGGWLGTATCMITLTVSVLPRVKSQITRLLAWLFKNKLIFGVLIVLFGILATAAGYFLFKQTVHPSHASLLQSRAEFWVPAWKAFIHSPIVGKGPYTFISTYLQANSVPPRSLFVYAHSIYVDLLHGSGALGVVTFGWFAYTLARSLLGRVRDPNGTDWAVSAGGLAALAAFTVHGIVDSVHHTIPTSAWTLAIVMGAAIATPGAKKRHRIGGGVFLGLAITILGWLNVITLLPMEAGVKAADNANWILAVEKFSRAVRIDPELACAYQQLGLAESQLAAAGEEDALPGAITAFERASALDPAWALNHANLGSLYRAQGDLVRAEAELRRAVVLAPDAAIYFLNLGAIEEENGKSFESLVAYLRVLALRPDWGDAYFWRQTEFRQRVLDNWRRNIPAETPLTLAELEARVAANPSEAWFYIDLADEYLQEGRLREADELLGKAGLAYSGSASEQLEINWLRADLEAQRGNLKTAVQLGESALDGWRQQGIFGPGTYGTLYYNQLMFRRPAMRDDIVPQMEFIHLTDDWGKRMNRLSGWYAELGDFEQAAAIQRELLVFIPDIQNQIGE